MIDFCKNYFNRTLEMALTKDFGNYNKVSFNALVFLRLVFSPFLFNDILPYKLSFFFHFCSFSALFAFYFHNIFLFNFLFFSLLLLLLFPCDFYIQCFVCCFHSNSLDLFALFMDIERECESLNAFIMFFFGTEYIAE